MTVHKLMTIGIGKYDSMIGIYICIYILVYENRTHKITTGKSKQETMSFIILDLSQLKIV